MTRRRVIRWCVPTKAVLPAARSPLSCPEPPPNQPCGWFNYAVNLIDGFSFNCLSATALVRVCGRVELYWDSHSLPIDPGMLPKHIVYLGWGGVSSSSRYLGITHLRESNSAHDRD